VGALGLSGLMAKLIFGVSPRDPVVFVLVPVVLVGVALVASHVPAWRASRIDPMVALRWD
jgi:putative ABC transport system permease protein